jgi:D-psicose/D-tagatose/L-ribulose 3-epimerase
MKKNIGLFVFLNLITLSHGMAMERPESSPKILMNLFVLTADLGKVKFSDLDKLVEKGAEGFELPGTLSTPSDCDRVGQYIKRHHFPAVLNVAVDHDRDPSSADKNLRIAGIKYLESRIDCAEAVGATILAGPIVLPLGNFPNFAGRDLREKYILPKLKIAQESLKEVSDYAQKKGIQLAFEYVTHWETPGLNTLRETNEFVKALNHPNFGVTLDMSHEVLDGEGPLVFAEQLKELNDMKKLFYVQVTGPNRGDLEFSWVPWKEFLTPLKKIWTGPLAVEMMNAVPPFASPNGAGLRISRVPFADPFEVAGRAIQLTQRKWRETQN